MKKVFVILALLASVIVVSCTPESLTNDDQQIDKSEIKEGDLS